MRNNDIYNLVSIIDRIIDKISKTEAFVSNNFATKEDACVFFNHIKSGLLKGDYDAIDRSVYIFANYGYLEDIAIGGGWKAEYQELDEEYSVIIRNIRFAQQRDGFLFSGVGRVTSSPSNSFATSPGRMIISDALWEFILEAYNQGFFKKRKVNKLRPVVQERICFGDTNPAIVMSVDPLLIAAYSYDLDAVVMLSFPQIFARKYGLKQYDRLISVNNYYSVMKHFDVFYGKKYTGWADVCPCVVDFLSDEVIKLINHKKNIPNSTWEHVKNLGIDYLVQHEGLKREGFWFVQ